jgi:splicing factor 3B subunit 3
LVEFYVGDTVTSITRTSMAPGGREVLLYTTIHGGIGILVPFVSKDDVEIFRTLEMALRNEIPPLCGRDHAAFRSSYFPVKGVVDGDLCELFNTLPNEKKRQIAEMVDRNVTEVSKKLEDARNRVAF